MEYMKVFWDSSAPDEPFLIYSELDRDRWEIRKIELYRDGSSRFSDALTPYESSILSIEPIPAFDDIAIQKEFRPFVIDRAEFETEWRRVASS